MFSNWGFPELRLAGAVAVFAVAGPELVRPARLLSLWLVGAAALGAVVLGTGLPSQVLGAIALGLGASALVRLAFGSAAGVPPTERVRAALASLGVAVTDLRIAERQRIGAAEFVGRFRGRTPIKVRVLGRDAQDTQRLARRWRLLAYRDPPRSAPIGRLEQVEHEAVATLMAAQAGVRVPEVVTVGLGPDKDALSSRASQTLPRSSSQMPDEVSDGTLGDLWQQVARLHARGHLARPAQRRQRARHRRRPDARRLLGGDARRAAVLARHRRGRTPRRLRGSRRSRSARSQRAIDAGWRDSIARVLPYLQRAALTPHLRDLARSHEVALADLRTAAARAAGTTPPEIVPLRRIRPKDLLLMAAVIFAAYLLISQLADIGFGTIADELRDAEPVVGRDRA